MIKLVQYRLFRRTEPAGKPPVFCSSEKYAKKERKVLTERGCSGIINLVLRRKAKNKTEKYAAVAHLVERHLAKVEVASSSLVSRSTFPKNLICGCSSSGRAPPCQGGGSEFEPRQPLQSVHLRKQVDFLFFIVGFMQCSCVDRGFRRLRTATAPRGKRIDTKWFLSS